MFTSRAEYRLNLRHDSCDQRLTQKGYDVGLQKEENLLRLKAKLEKIEAVKDLLGKHKYGQKSAVDALKMTEVSMENLQEVIVELDQFEEHIRYQVELDIKYAGYINRQDRQIARFEKLEGLEIPADFNYDTLDGLSTESREKLKKIRPHSVGQATRISGVRNGDIAILIIHVDKGGRNG